MATIEEAKVFLFNLETTGLYPTTQKTKKQDFCQIGVLSHPDAVSFCRYVVPSIDFQDNGNCPCMQAIILVVVYIRMLYYTLLYLSLHASPVAESKYLPHIHTHAHTSTLLTPTPTHTPTHTHTHTHTHSTHTQAHYSCTHTHTICNNLDTDRIAFITLSCF